MIGLRLIVETPRGGEAGHRFLTSRHDMGDSEVASVATEASQNAVGRSYISVSRQVTQRLPNGAVREGAERMILVGLDVDLLQPEQTEQVKSELTSFLLSLDTLIASMDWPSGNRSTVIACKELRNWVAGEMFARLPLSEWTVVACSQKSALPLRSVKNWLLIGTIILACGGMIWLSTRPDRQSGITKDPRPSLPVNDEARVQELARKWGCAPEDLVRSLKRAHDWDKRRDADSLSLKLGLSDPDVIEMLNKITTRIGSDQFWGSPSTEAAVADGFNSFVRDYSVKSAEEMIGLRKWLYSTWLQFNDLKQAAGNARDFLNREQQVDNFSSMLVSVALYETEVGLGKFFQEPATPLIEQQDIMIYRLLDHYCKSCRDAGFPGSTERSLDRVGENDFANFIYDVRIHDEALLAEIKESRKNLCDSIHEKQGGESKDAVFEAYQSFEKFIEQLSKNPIR